MHIFLRELTPGIECRKPRLDPTWIGRPGGKTSFDRVGLRNFSGPLDFEKFLKILFFKCNYFYLEGHETSRKVISDHKIVHGSQIGATWNFTDFIVLDKKFDFFPKNFSRLLVVYPYVKWPSESIAASLVTIRVELTRKINFFPWNLASERLSPTFPCKRSFREPSTACSTVKYDFSSCSSYDRTFKSYLGLIGP